MDIIVSFKSYNSYGGHHTISLVGQYFEFNCPMFGEAITEIDITVYFSGGKVRKTLEKLYEEFHLGLKGLPCNTFERKKSVFKIDFVSDVGEWSDIPERGEPSLLLFRRCAYEIASKLQMIKKKLKKSDDFNYTAFEVFIQEKLANMPDTEAELLTLKAKLDEEHERKLNEMDEWEKLGIDWDDYHPNARELLNEPFFWQSDNDFSPNGNDTGFDVLSIYRDWRVKKTETSGQVFFDGLMNNWEVNIPPEDDYSREIYEQSIIGLAFAQIKIDGVCESDIASSAVNAIEDTKVFINLHHSDWDLLDERIQSFDDIKRVLSFLTSVKCNKR